MIVGLDVGGTHTDVVVIEGRKLLRKVKLPTERQDLLETICSGVSRAVEGLAAGRIERLVVSTTLATNAIVQGQTEPVGVLIESGPGMNPYGFAVGEHYHVVAGAIDYRGRELAPLRAEEIREIGRELRSKGIRNLAVVGKFSVRNPQHELQMRHLLADGFDSLSLGHQLSGQLNFPRRIATAYLNAAVTPISREFYGAVRRCLQRQGLGLPLEILKADGGTMSFERCQQYAVETILSGPAASILGTLGFADRSREEVVLDIGGTSTDMAILVDGVPLLEPLGIRIGGYNTLVRALRTVSIGVGGDSWVRVEDGEIRVGPERKGRALAYGGPEPTPTDALLVLEGGSGMERQRAREAVGQLAGKLGLSVEQAARAVVGRTCALILRAVQEMVTRVNQKPVYTVRELLRGRVVAPTGLTVIGGPARQLAPWLEQMSGWPMRVPPDYEVANAIGAAVARTTCEVTVLADTARGHICAPEEGYADRIGRRTTNKEVIELCFDLLREKALRLGASESDLEMELIENQVFNMVRGFSTVGQNMRVRAQIKPGLISPYREAAV